MQNELGKAHVEMLACNTRQEAAESQEEINFWGRQARRWERKVQRLSIAKRAEEAERIGKIIDGNRTGDD